MAGQGQWTPSSLPGPGLGTKRWDLWHPCSLLGSGCLPLGAWKRKTKGKGKTKEKRKEQAFFLSVDGFSPSSHLLQQTPRTNPNKHRRRLPELSHSDFMNLIYANTAQNELNIANYINNLNSVAKNTQEYLNNLKVFTCKFYKFCVFFFFS